MKITREPAVWLAFVGALITWAAGLNLDWLNAGQAVALTTFITAVVMAFFTRPVAPALFTAAVSAGAALFAQYGLHWSEQAVTGLGMIVLAGFALFGIRPQVSPVEKTAVR